MNIQTREQFEYAVKLIKEHDFLVVDTETNTLRVIEQAEPMVSVQVYIPATAESFNFAFRQGQGSFDVKYSNTNDEHTDPMDMSWQGSTKQSLMVSHFYELWKEQNEGKLGNLPIAWLEELKPLFAGKTLLFHNARFDLHVLDNEGFELPAKVLDTMIMLSVAWNDWNRTKYKVKWADKAVYGNRRLKWQAKYWNFPDAEHGEQTLSENMVKFERELAEFILADFDKSKDKANHWISGIVYSTYLKNPDKLDKNGVSFREKQLDRIQKKVAFNSKSELWTLPSSAVTVYGELDVILTYQLYDKLKTILEAWADYEFFEELCWIQYELAFKMEQNGFKLDAEETQRRVASILAEQAEITQKYEDLGLNIASPAQVKKHLGIDKADKSALEAYLEELDDSDIEVDADDLELGLLLTDVDEEAWKIELCNDVLNYRKLGKEATTYLGKWYDNRDVNDFVHGSFDVSGTKTGRTSSGGSAGNFQNIPDRTYDIKNVIVPYDDYILFAYDYSQLEARLASWIAETLLGFDPKNTMTTLFNEGVDMHSYTAEMLDIRSLVFGNMSVQEIADLRGLSYKTNADLEALVWKRVIRQMGKTANFGLLYGGSAGMAMHLLGVEYDVADELVQRWNNLFPAFAKAQEYYTNLSLDRRPTPTGVGSRYMYVEQPVPFHYGDDHTGYTEFWWGRKIKHHAYDTYRWVRDKYKDGFKQVNPQQKSCQKAWNGIVQGLGGYICLESGARFYRDFDSDGVRIFAQIHDALDGYVHTNSMSKVAVLGEVMKDWDTNPILEVELEASTKNWQSMRTVIDFELWVDSKGREGYE